MRAIQSLILLTSVFISSLVHAQSLNINCSPPHAGEDLIRIESRQIESIKELKEVFERTYDSGFRLRDRWYYSASEDLYLGKLSGREVKIPKSFITNITKQIEVALERGYADYIIYADMGHGHLLVDIGAPQSGLTLEEAFKLENSQMLYHTAELLKLRSGASFLGPIDLDPWLAWRYHSRNFVARNNSSDSLAVLFGGKNGAYNTVRNIPGVREFATVYFSATKNGCFSYKAKGETFNFDISFSNSPSRRR